MDSINYVSLGAAVCIGVAVGNFFAMAAYLLFDTWMRRQ